MKIEEYRINILVGIAERGDLTEEGQKDCAKLIKDLLYENKQWETNYNNLSAEFEEVSAIAQAQAKELEKLRGGK
jgi:hypothetical protein